MRLAVCDDDRREQDLLEKALQGWDPTRSMEKFYDGVSLLAAAKESPPFDVVFLDIYLPGENGIEIAKNLRQISPETGIVFVTTSRDHAVDAFSLDVLHYLVKPVTTEGIVESFRRLTALRARQQKMFSFPVERDICTVYLSQIYTLESFNHDVEISLDDGRQLQTRTPMYELEQKLDNRFLRIKRGVIVNMDHIERMGTDKCVLRDGRELFLATRDRSAIRASYNEYVLSRLSRRGGSGEVGS